jgi:dipeptidyl aminopeptidase/acylaminoacyl peptidase
VAAGKVWISPIGGGSPAPLGNFDTPFIGDASWSPDGRWMAFDMVVNHGTKFVKIRVGAGDPPVILADSFCGFASSWSPDGGRILCGKNGRLYTIPSEGGEPAWLGEEYEPLATWSRDVRYIYTIRKADEKRQLGRLDWKGGAFQPIVDIPLEWVFRGTILQTISLSLSHDGKSLATTLQKPSGDIWILDGFQLPPTLWRRLWRKPPLETPLR